MAKLDLMQFAQAEVPEGETAIAAVRVNWNGMVPPVPLQSGGITGLTGIIADQMDGPPEAAILPEPDPEVLVVFPSAKQMALVLTEFRLLVWSLNFSAKPKNYIGEVPLLAITSVEAGGGGFGEVIRISLASTAIVDLEILRGEPADEFVAELTSRIPAPQ